MGCEVSCAVTGSALVGTGIAMQLCKSGSADAADKLGCTVSATLRIGCDWQLGRSVIGMLLCIELQLGYVVLQVALLTHAKACNRIHSSDVYKWDTR